MLPLLNTNTTTICLRLPVYYFDYSITCSPTLLELDSTIDEVKPALAKIEVMLQQSRSKVLQYNAYEATYGFPISEYYDLIAAEKNLVALKTVWKSTEEWESMYTRWAGAEFSQLDVEDLKVCNLRKLLFSYKSNSLI